MSPVLSQRRSSIWCFVSSFGAIHHACSQDLRKGDNARQERTEGGRENEKRERERRREGGRKRGKGGEDRFHPTK